MKKKSIVCGVIATTVAVAATFGGCSLVSTNTAADMNQTIAVVDISKAAALDKQFEDYKAAVGETSIIKRELVAYFINYGYSYVQNYGYTYEQTFNLLLDSLVENAVLVQYSTMYLLDKLSAENSNAVNEFIAASKHSEAAKYEYLLNEGKDEVSDDVKIAEYNLRSSINSAIDTYEKKILDEEDSSAGTDTRTTPTGVDTQKEDYYPQKSKTDNSLDYNIYTGYYGYTLEQSGAYQKDKLDGTTIATRIKAYNEFISSLASSSYDLVDAKAEDLRKVRDLSYIQDEYVSQLEQRVINKYYDVYEEEQEKLLKQIADENSNNDYSLIIAAYNNLYNSQAKSYETESNFTSAMDSMSDTSFVLYAPEGEDGGKFGYVYNILLPFSDAQSDALKALQSVYADSDLDGGYKPDYYVTRNSLLNQIKTTDQRAAWFNGETEYAFDATDNDINYYKTANNSSYLFFENNVASSDKYEALDKYAGLYPYNGTVREMDDDYLLIPNKLDINDMLVEFENYIKHVSGCTATTNKTQNYGDNLADNLYKSELVNGKKVIDYSNFIYATGKVDFGVSDNKAYKANLLNKDSKQYQVLSAVNELQYAYTTDTGVLSQYLGYSVQAGDTSYIKEFEHAAHQAVNSGAGSYAVCAGDYGWHLIYVTYTYDVGAQYEPVWNETNITTEGTFENLFYEWFKSNTLSDVSTQRRNAILTDFKGDATVTKYESRYKNLLELENN